MYPGEKNLGLNHGSQIFHFPISGLKKKNSFRAVGTLLIFLTYNWARCQLLVTGFIKDNDHNLLCSTEKAGFQLLYPRTDVSGSPDGLIPTAQYQLVL